MAKEAQRTGTEEQQPELVAVEGQWEGCRRTAGALADLSQITWILLNASSEQISSSC